MTELQAANEAALDALYQASVVGRTDVVRSAIEGLRSVLTDSCALKAAISRPRDSDGATALHLASWFNHADVVRALLNVDCDLLAIGKGGDFKGKRPYDCCGGGTNEATASSNQAKEAFHVFLFEAVAMNNCSRVTALLDGGISTQILDGSLQKETLLHWAVSFGHDDTVRTLLEHAADPNSVNAAQESPLEQACKKNNVNIAELLIEEGAGDLFLDDFETLLPADTNPKILAMECSRN